MLCLMIWTKKGQIVQVRNSLLCAIFLVIVSVVSVYAEDEYSVFDVTEDSGAEADDSLFSNMKGNSKINTNIALESGYYDTARMIVLNKITANAKKITIAVGKSAFFNNAEIKLQKCWKSPDKYVPTSQMLIDVTENKFDDDSKSVFHGWIISSQAALSSIEHPVYQILAVDCMGNKVH